MVIRALRTLPGMGLFFNYSFNNDTWKKWFGPKDEKGANDKKDEKAGRNADEMTDGNGRLRRKLKGEGRC